MKHMALEKAERDFTHVSGSGPQGCAGVGVYQNDALASKTRVKEDQ